MVRRGSGHLVFISSVAGKTASPESSIYSATKFGLRGFALGLRQDLRPHGVGVSTIFPGFISDAGMYADTGIKLPPGVGTRTPEDVAAAVIRAIERNRAEIDVAPPAVRFGAALGGIAPQSVASITRLFGSEKLAAEFSVKQIDKR
jgi:short-subunit dehydrogenase